MAGRIAVPFVRERYEPDTRTIGDLLRERGQIAAREAQERAAINANLARGLASIAGDTIQGITRYAADQPRRDYLDTRTKAAQDEMARDTSVRDVIRMVPPNAETGRMDPAAIAKEVQAIDPERALAWWSAADGQQKAQIAAEAEQTTKLTQMLGAFEISTRGMDPRRRDQAWKAARAQAIETGLATPEMVPEQYSPAFVKRSMAELMTVGEQFKQLEQAVGEPFTLSPGQARFDAEGQQIANVAPTPKAPERFKVTVPGPNGQPIDKLVTAEELSQGVPVYQAPSQSGDEPLMAVIGDDGQPVLMRRSEAEGRRPASGRQQGRPVTSGDAGRIAEFNTALDDLTTLRGTLKGNDATGAAAKVGAALPNVVTEFTGWGSDAKQKQAVIDRVKQVIGKALEGGVLRKEDEYKYTKILPTIGDPAEVVSAKLDGLEQAITLRQQRTLEALADAGYDTTKFQEPATEDGTTVTTPDGQTFTFPTKAAADAFKKRAGIP